MKTKQKIVCHDCGRELKEGEEAVIYNLEEKGTFYKCADCYAKNENLTNFQPCEVYSRIVGYIRPIDQWNEGKRAEYADRQEFVANVEGCRTGC